MGTVAAILTTCTHLYQLLSNAVRDRLGTCISHWKMGKREIFFCNSYYFELSVYGYFKVEVK